jgi:hypothetical protein
MQRERALCTTLDSSLPQLWVFQMTQDLAQQLHQQSSVRKGQKAQASVQHGNFQTCTGITVSDVPCRLTTAILTSVVGDTLWQLV